MNLPLKRNAQPTGAPNWHPNFRNTQLLPDLKVVRTTFFINAACIGVAVAALMFTGYREYQAFNYRSGMAEARQRMEAAKTENDRFLAQNKQFMGGVKKIEEAEAFVDSRISATQLLVSLASTLPELTQFSTIAYEKSQLTLRGLIKQDSESASRTASSYLDTLRSEPFIGKNFTDISLINLQRDPGAQAMTFEILLKQAVVTEGRKPAGVRK